MTISRSILARDWPHAPLVDNRKYRRGEIIVGLLLITHDYMGQILLDTVAQTFGHLPMPAEAIPVFGDTDPDECQRYCEARAQALDQGDGLIIFTDICGATPDNIAKRLSSDSRMVITGLSLPMLFRVFNNPTLSLEMLSKKAISGGHDGIICE